MATPSTGLAAAAMDAGAAADEGSGEDGGFDEGSMLADVSQDLLDNVKSGDASAFADNLRAFIELVGSSAPPGA